MALNEIFDESQLDALQEAAYRILSQTGMVFQNERILDALEAKGAQVDRESQVARLPVSLIEEVAKPKDAASSVPANPTRVEGDYTTGVSLQIAQFYYDYDRKERRPSNRQDLIEMTRFGDALDPALPVSQSLLLREEPPLVEPLEALYLLLENTSRPGYVYPHFARQMDYLAEIGEIVCGDRMRFLIGGIFIVSPLRMDRRAADLMVKRAELGLSTGIGTMPVAGISAPVTTAGVIALAAAEILGAWAALRALDTRASLSAGICSGSLDMRTSSASFSSPEAMLQDVGCVELFRRRFGGRCGVAGGADYTSAKLPGIQAAFEKCFESMAITSHTGATPHMGGGMLDQGKMFSPVQLLLDQELGSALWHFGKGVEVNSETLALEMMEEIGHGFRSNFLATDHTAQHFRKALWFPTLLDRTGWESDEAEHTKEKALLQRANERYHEIMARYIRPEVDPKMLAEARKVIDRARKELL